MNNSEFLYPYHSYYGKNKINSIEFNRNLQNFSVKVGYICNLQTSGKLSSHQAYQRIELLWNQLQIIAQELKIDSSG